MRGAVAAAYAAQRCRRIALAGAACGAIATRSVTQPDTALTGNAVNVASVTRPAGVATRRAGYLPLFSITTDGSIHV